MECVGILEFVCVMMATLVRIALKVSLLITMHAIVITLHGF